MPKYEVHNQLKNVLHSDISREEKFRYLAGYYWKAAAAIAVAVVLAGYFVYTQVTAKGQAFNIGVFVNVANDDAQPGVKKQVEKWVTYDKDKDNLVVTWDTISQSSAAMQRLVDGIAASEIDLAVVQPKIYRNYQKQGSVATLPLSKAQVAKYRTKLIFKNGKATGVYAGKLPLFKKYGLTNQVMFFSAASKHRTVTQKVLVKMLAQ
ncbi:hypothetical protein [Lacticaseibacillus parakribbianus]|uniref:hypothetical protein n=1 Tax=Lacticaseibacillus parakribbianus TaxID=2970927 RepID=UPI0021CB7BE5|nr:hypothetical protein [Lacticaseibacillus parakribbianus]